MTETEYDVVIIGGGVSGLMAGIHLLERGRRVAVISRGDPIVCLSTGCVDLLAKGEDPLSMISSLPENHPYCLVEKNEISEALESFKEIMSSTGIKYLGRADTNRGILTPIGTIKTTCLVPETMYHAPTKRDEYMHIISFAGLKDFYPGYITARFHNADFSVYDAGATPTMAIAQQFELEPFREKFISWLKCIDIIGEKVGIPAVLGISSPSEVIREIEEQVKRPVFEIPTSLLRFRGSGCLGP